VPCSSSVLVKNHQQHMELLFSVKKNNMTQNPLIGSASLDNLCFISPKPWFHVFDAQTHWLGLSSVSVNVHVRITPFVIRYHLKSLSAHRAQCTSYHPVTRRLTCQPIKLLAERTNPQKLLWHLLHRVTELASRFNNSRAAINSAAS